MSARSAVDKDHPGWKLSRECIRDTLIAKRTGAMKKGGLCANLCKASLKMLRDTQLAVHQEEKMIPGRYLKLYQMKQAAPDIVIVIRGGLIEAIYSSNSLTNVMVADYDIRCPSEYEYTLRESAEERVARGDMHELCW